MTSRVVIIVLGGIVVVGGASALVFMNRQTAEAPAATTAPATANPTDASSSSSARPAPAPPRPAGTPAAKTPAPEPTPEPAPALGTLIIESDVPETSVFIDRVYLGNAPVTAKNLAPGPHRLNMSVTGYEGVSETIDVEPGTRTISMKFKEITLDEKIDVRHKHGVGWCSGTLRASPQRLAYETTNAGDAFAIALTNLEAFEVDYIQKNLKVKLRGGKTYNFTDVEDNVNRLYQFHQTVEKVRQRLMTGKLPQP